MIGAVVRLIDICVLPKYGRLIGKETGYMTKMADRMKNTKVTMENPLIMMALGLMDSDWYCDEVRTVAKFVNDACTYAVNFTEP
jgi:hypothetical protein